RLRKNEQHTIEAVVDRLVIRDGIRVRLNDSIETALKWGGNKLSLLRSKQKTSNATTRTLSRAGSPTSDVESETWEQLRYSTAYGHAESGFTLRERTPKHVQFIRCLG